MYIMVHLNQVLKHRRVNRVNVQSLATVFGPILVRLPNDVPDITHSDMSYHVKIVELLLTNVSMLSQSPIFNPFSLA
jgi:hypothetical protein